MSAETGKENRFVKAGKEAVVAVGATALGIFTLGYIFLPVIL